MHNRLPKQTKMTALMVLRALREPLATLSVLLLVFNVLLPQSSAQAFTILCAGNSPGGISVALTADSEQTPPTHRPHCPLCTPPESTPDILPPAIATQAFEQQAIAVRFAHVQKILASSKRARSRNARAPPTV